MDKLLLKNSSLREETFLESYPSYRTTETLDLLRAREYDRLDRGNHVYLDYTGGGLYSKSQVQKHHDLLMKNVFGNPHSENPASVAATRLVEQARATILKFFHADPEEYVAIFTSNASGALKLVGESYPFSNGRFLLTFDNHNSVNGIREFARSRNGSVTYVPVVPPNMNVQSVTLQKELSQPSPNGNNLFAFPAQSNFSGVQHSTKWVDRAKEAGWDVLLDAAAYTPTNRLDLSQVKPDFVPISFYKMFGYPTGIGTLIAKKQALAKLHRPWFAGGTITVASVQADKYRLESGAQGFEDGTLDYLNIPAIEIGLKHLESIGYDVIHERVRCLTGWLLDNLSQMKHSTGQALARIFGPTTMEGRGGTVTFNLFDKNGKIIDHHFIESAAAAKNISLRTGCFCNPGAGEAALQISRSQLTACFAQHTEDRLSKDDLLACVDRKSSGAIRVSIGLVTNFADVEAFLRFAEGLVN
jgi:molybdenum cofactor sulfurtransferase